MFVFVKKFITACAAICAVVGVPYAACADEIVNVEYIVGFVKNKWDVDVPYVAEEKLWAANVEYLLKVVDYVNGKLNNGEKTNYGESEYATKEVVDTVAANQAIRTLIKKKGMDCPENAFCFVPETDDTTYSFNLVATGSFTIDWGDGNVQEIEKTTTASQDYSHTYTDGKAANKHAIKMMGQASSYVYPKYTIGSVVRFSPIRSMEGCLGCIFSTLAGDTQPGFYSTFANSTFTEIPENLFDGISGPMAKQMFHSTFYGCASLKSIPEKLFSNVYSVPGGDSSFLGTFSDCISLKEIPENLFANPNSVFSYAMFHSTFKGCTGLTSIPEGLFSKITLLSQAVSTITSLFQDTFSGCTGLTSIPAGLFAGMTTTPADFLFDGTFYGCSGLTEIPEHLFDSIDPSGNHNNAFASTFYNCTSLRGPSAKINGRYLYEIWPSALNQRTYYNDTGLDDYDAMPSGWKDIN